MVHNGGTSSDIMVCLSLLRMYIAGISYTIDGCDSGCSQDRWAFQAVHENKWHSAYVLPKFRMTVSFSCFRLVCSRMVVAISQESR